MLILLALVLVTLYLAPVIPVARRIEYVKTRPVLTKVNPNRQVTKFGYPGADYVYINDSTERIRSVCNNCGGSRDFHKGGTYSTLRNYGNEPRYKVCSEFAPWTREDNMWGYETQWITPPSRVGKSILEATYGWVPMVLSEAVKHAAAKSGKSFAIEYRGPETLDERLVRLEARNLALEKELGMEAKSIDARS